MDRRYARAAIPTLLVDGVVNPLGTVLKDHALATRADEAFAEWLLVPQGDDRPSLVGVTDHPVGSADFLAVKDLLFEEILPALEAVAGVCLDEERSEVTSVEELRLHTYL